MEAEVVLLSAGVITGAVGVLLGARIGVHLDFKAGMTTVDHPEVDVVEVTRAKVAEMTDEMPVVVEMAMQKDEEHRIFVVAGDMAGMMQDMANDLVVIRTMTATAEEEDVGAMTAVFVEAVKETGVAGMAKMTPAIETLASMLLQASQRRLW